MTPTTKKRFDRRPSAEKAAGIVESFNRFHAVGTPVWYWKKLPMGPVVETTIREAAFVADSGHAVCFLKGVSGFVDVMHIQFVNEARRADLSIEIVPQ